MAELTPLSVWPVAQQLPREPRVRRRDRRALQFAERPDRGLLGDCCLERARAEAEAEQLCDVRPALPHEVARFDDFTLRRLRVKPGITGLWQVSGRSDATFATYSRMDTFYAENWTLAGDLRILLRTIPVVLGSRGAY